MSGKATPHGQRLLDATLSECILHSERPLDVSDVERLTETLPFDWLKGATPLPPAGTPGFEVYAFTAARSHAVEPITWEAHAYALDADLPGTRGRILVDPTGVRLGDAPLEADTVAAWQREQVAWTRAGDSAEETTQLILARLAALPAGERLRVRDPHAKVTPESAARLAQARQADRLTLHLEDARGLALASARAALRAGSGDATPLVRCSVLGIGPRSGIPATERLVALTRGTAFAAHNERLEAAAQLVAALTAHAIPARHPFWGEAMQRAAEPEQAGSAPSRLRTNAATLPLILDTYLAEWNVTLRAETRDAILQRLRNALRPGEELAGPVLWALVAQELHVERPDEPA